MPRKFKSLPATSGGPPETPANFENLPQGGGGAGSGGGTLASIPGGPPAGVAKNRWTKHSTSKASSHTPPTAAMRETQPADVAMHEVTVVE